MPDKTNYSPNQRVDLPDMFRTANDYTSESLAFLAQKVLHGDRGVILSGFRMRVINDPGNPAKVVVFNGMALDDNGVPLNNEANPAYAQEITLSGANTTFYLEVVFEENTSNDDARAFWDPTLDNAAPIPDGREFAATVPTRITPTWRIVRPVSTVGFTYSLATPNTNRIPLARFRTNGTNQIVVADNPGLLTGFPNTVTTRDFVGTGVQIKVADAALFSDGVDNGITIDPDGLGAGPIAATVANVDRVNNILTLSGAPGGGTHVAGTVIRASGRTSDYVQQRTDEVPTDPSTHPDNAFRLFQGSEERGSGLTVSKEDGSARDDLNLQTLKDQVDFLAAQLREVKWGATRVEDNGVEATRVPPLTFDLVNNPPRYFDKTRGIQGAGSYTLTVGDGVNSYGDFNASDGTAIQAAIDAASSGDTVFIKSGVYNVTTSITLTKSLTFIGDGFNTQIIFTTNNAPLFSCSNASLVTWKDLVLSASGTNVQRLIQWTDATAGRVTIRDCGLYGSVDPGVPASLIFFRVSGCYIFSSIDNHTIFGNPSNTTDVEQLIFRDNLILTLGDSINILRFGEIDNLEVSNLIIDASETITGGTRSGRLLYCEDIQQGFITNINLEHLNTRGLGLLQVTGIAESLTVDGVYLSGAASFQSLDPMIEVFEFTNLSIRNLFTEDPVSGPSISGTYKFLKIGEGCTSNETELPNRLTVEDCYVTFNSVTNGIFLAVGGTGTTALISSNVSRCAIEAASTAMTFTHRGRAFVDCCYIDGLDQNTNSSQGILAGNNVNSSVLDVYVRDTSIFRLKRSTALEINGIAIDQATAGLASNSITNLYVNGGVIADLGYSTATSTSAVNGIKIANNANFAKLDISRASIAYLKAPGFAQANGVLILGNAVTTNSTGLGIIVTDNDILNIGDNDNFVVGIGIFLQTGTIPVDYTRISGNFVSGQSSSPANFGIVIRASSSSVSYARIIDNIVVMNQAFSAFGAQISIEAQDVSTLKISGNTTYGGFFGGGGTSCLLLPTDTTDGGTWSYIKITDNEFIGANDLFGPGEGTIYGILLAGIAGSVANSYTEWDDINISGNSIVQSQTQYTASPIHSLFVRGYMTDVKLANNTMLGQTYNISRGHVWLDGVAASESYRVTITGNTAFGPSGTYADPGVRLAHINEFTMTGNSWNPANSGASTTPLVSFISCLDGTIAGNIMGANTGAGGEVSFDANCRRILGVGNVFPTTSGGTASGTSAANGVVFNTGNGVAVDGTGELNLTI